jgi:hypothetical protein
MGRVRFSSGLCPKPSRGFLPRTPDPSPDAHVPVGLYGPEGRRVPTIRLIGLCVETSVSQQLPETGVNPGEQLPGTGVNTVCLNSGLLRSNVKP